jgi:putative aminopeptidase FrvX
MTAFLMNYIDKNMKHWAKKPEVHFGDALQDGIIMTFGKPRTAIFAHMDTVGYTVRYNKQLVRIGAPVNQPGDILVGEDSKGSVECKFALDEDGKPAYEYSREIERGTNLTYKPSFRETVDYVQGPYMDNRLGMYVALKVAESLEHGAICFTCYEEHGGGSAENMGRILYEKHHLQQALISDITWVTEGVHPGKGVAISLRDSGIPRRSYVNRIIEIARKHRIPHQLEVEGSGGSDGNSLQRSPYPYDWCFVGAAEDNVHTPNEMVHKADIQSMIDLYAYLMREL